MTFTLTTPEVEVIVASDGPRLLLVDDHQLLVETLQMSLKQAGFDVSVPPGVSFDQVLATAAEVRPTLVVLDLDLQGSGYGYDLIGPLRELGAEVLVLTGTTDRIELARCLEAGALGIASKTHGFGHVLDQIRRAAGGETVTPVTERAQLLADLSTHRRATEQRQAPFEVLSARERNVLRQIVDGQQAAAIAKASFVSLATIRTQIRSILMKLDVTSQVAAVALARQGGWFDTLAVETTR
ncbi:MAG: two-component system, NarL family, nitrate/nitrite response regulator NarL [Actinomycetota bacterium]|jgi:DNA-binding NarL/FixJ family response regulator|nr:two-component system, NarL family, nitrate/nitrite response regulator NarL [Actinomycetota bacterium]